MRFLSKLIGRGTGLPAKPIDTYADFWEWFTEHQSGFHEIVRTKDPTKIEQGVFAELSGALGELKDGFFFLIGMLDSSTADLVFTADGNPKNIVFVEALVAAAPQISGWQFTPLKQPEAGFNVRMNGEDFGPDSLSFYPIAHDGMPDLVHIVVVHEALDGPSAESAKQGAYIFLDNFLGELNFLTRVDDLNFLGPKDAVKELIPIEALPNYLEMRQALFA